VTNRRKRKHPTLLLSLISVFLLVLAIPDFWPYAYYQILRFAICASGVYHAYRAYLAQKKILVGFAVVVAVLFNPLVPIYFEKETWVIIDGAVAVGFLVMLFALVEEADEGNR
jgi:hypothetical protein